MEKECEILVNEFKIPLCLGLFKQIIARFILPKIDFPSLIFKDKYHIDPILKSTVDNEYRLLNNDCKLKAEKVLARLNGIIDSLDLIEIGKQSLDLDKEWIRYKTKISNFSVFNIN